eukprot:8645568-Alexandrium_andersonii.AAC.1
MLLSKCCCPLGSWLTPASESRRCAPSDTKRLNMHACGAWEEQRAAPQSHCSVCHSRHRAGGRE